MPVGDTDPHAITQRTSAQPYGCFNKENSSDGYFMPHRNYLPGGTFTMGVRWISMGVRWIRHTMSVGCRYDASLEAPRCEGCCRRGEGEAYANKISASPP